MQVPSEYICPITLAIMQNPVIDSHGHHFEKVAIVEWITLHHTCPISREWITASMLHPATDLKKEITVWKEKGGSSSFDDEGDVDASPEKKPTLAKEKDRTVELDVGTYINEFGCDVCSSKKWAFRENSCFYCRQCNSRQNFIHLTS
jgi:hypothetical protein